jgi:hypothetical protein
MGHKSWKRILNFLTYKLTNKLTTLNKKILTFIILANAFTPIFCQSEDKMGLIVGLNYAMINLIEEEAQQNGKLGFYIGSSRKFKISNKVNFRPELIFSLQRTQYQRNLNFISNDPAVPLGFQDENGQFVDLRNIDVNINEYIIQIPFIFEYVLKEKVNIAVGPQLGYVLVERTSNNNESTYDFGQLDDYRLGISYAASLGYLLSDIYSINFRFINRITIRNTLKNRVIQMGMIRSF